MYLSGPTFASVMLTNTANYYQGSALPLPRLPLRDCVGTPEVHRRWQKG